MVLAVLIQAVDLSPAPAFIADTGLHGFRNPLNSRFWDIAAPYYQRIILIPSNLCERSGYVEYSAFALLAGRHRMAINSGMTARYDVRKAVAYCESLDEEIANGLTTPGSLYVVRRDLMPHVSRRVGPNGPICTTVDGLGVCISADSYRPWRDAFEIPRGNLPPTAELTDFYGALDDTYRIALGRSGQYRADTTSRRVDALARYLADRLDGCTHAEAETRTLAMATNVAEPAPCAELSGRSSLPAADETHAFARRYAETMGTQSDIAQVGTHVDLEGEAVWLQAYISHRLGGQSHRQATEAVLDTIRNVAR
jgi:hypothetical protein